MTDDDAEFRPMDRVAVVEGTEPWRIGARRGIVLSTDQTYMQVIREMAADQGRSPSELAAELAGPVPEWAAHNHPVVKVIFDEMAPGSEADRLPPSHRVLACRPRFLVRVGTIYEEFGIPRPDSPPAAADAG